MFTAMKPFSPRMRALKFCIQIIMACGSSTFGSTLRGLTLTLSHESYVYALTRTVVFPGLEELSLHMSWSPCRPVNDGPNLMRNRLIPFLHNHDATLHSLKLGFTAYTPLANISSDLVGMHQLPRLRKLDIFDASTKNDDSGLRHLLEIHADSLIELRLDFALNSRSSRTEWYSRSIFHIALPHCGVYPTARKFPYHSEIIPSQTLLPPSKNSCECIFRTDHPQEIILSCR